MCASCGCGIPEDDHGDPRNIVFSELTAAAKAQGIAENDVVNNMHAMVHQSHKVDQKSDPEPIKDAKTKALEADLVKDWTVWDAERAAENAGKGKFAARWTGEMAHNALMKAGFKPHEGRKFLATGHESPAHRDHYLGTLQRYQHPSGALAEIHRQFNAPGSNYTGTAHVYMTHTGKGTGQHYHNGVHGQKALEAGINRAIVKSGGTVKAATPLDKAVKSLLKGAQRIETGQFTGKNDNTHSHRMKDEIVTHSHDGDKGHTHPARDYGPSFNHR